MEKEVTKACALRCRDTVLTQLVQVSSLTTSFYPQLGAVENPTHEEQILMAKELNKFIMKFPLEWSAIVQDVRRHSSAFMYIIGKGEDEEYAVFVFSSYFAFVYSLPMRATMRMNMFRMTEFETFDILEPMKGCRSIVISEIKRTSFGEEKENKLFDGVHDKLKKFRWYFPFSTKEERKSMEENEEELEQEGAGHVLLDPNAYSHGVTFIIARNFEDLPEKCVVVADGPMEQVYEDSDYKNYRRVICI